MPAAPGNEIGQPKRISNGAGASTRRDNPSFFTPGEPPTRRFERFEQASLGAVFRFQRQVRITPPSA